MEENKSYKKEYTLRRLAFSLSCIGIVLIAGFILVNSRSWGWNLSKTDIYILAIVSAIIIYFLKVKIWKCPACGHSFSMGTTSPTGIKSSSLDSCPKCSTSFK